MDTRQAKGGGLSPDQAPASSSDRPKFLRRRRFLFAALAGSLGLIDLLFDIGGKFDAIDPFFSIVTLALAAVLLVAAIRRW